MRTTDLTKTAVKQMLEREVILNRTDEMVVRFLTPFVITKQQIDVALHHLLQILRKNAMKPAPRTRAKKQTAHQA